MTEIINSLRELDFVGIVFMTCITLVQIGLGIAAGLVVGAMLWRPRRHKGLFIPPHRRF